MSSEKREKIITLTTDFGLHDPFVGIMKGVILQICPDVNIIDVSHQIDRHDIESAAFIINCAYKYFPQGTIHCIVIDPGVGSDRGSILAVTDKYKFIAPDNGVLSYIYDKEGIKEVYLLTESRYFLSNISNTFHARDIFAPISAWLANGINPKEFGPQINNYIQFPLEKAQVYDNGRRIVGKIIYIDYFGNLITNIQNSLILKALKGEDTNLRVKVDDIIINGLSQAYSHKEKGVGAILGSHGYLELFIFQNSMANITGIKKGDLLEVIIE